MVQVDGSGQTARGLPALRRWSAAAPNVGGIVAVTVLALAWKYPNTLLHGRLFGEEATAFVPAIAGASLVDASTYLYRGSLLLLTNWAVWLATLVPVEWLPSVTTWLGTVLLLGVMVQFAGWARDHRLPRGATLLVASGFVLTPLMDELLANGTNMQWLCSVSALLLLLAAPEASGRRLPAKVGWLLLCGLTGVPSCFLAPFFWARAVLERSRPHLILAVALSLATAVQAYCVLTSELGERPLQFSPLIVATAIGLHDFVLPAVGKQGAALIGHLVVPAGLAPLRSLPLIAACAAGTGAVAWWARRAGLSGRTVLLILVAPLAVTAINCFGVLGQPRELLDPNYHTRYFILFFFGLLLLLAAASRLGGVPGGRTGLALAWITLIGAAIYFPGRGGWIDSGPAWRPQIETCRRAGQARCTVETWPSTAGSRKWITEVPL